MAMNILVINCGSSSIKFKRLSVDAETPRAHYAGLLDHLGEAGANLSTRRFDGNGADTRRELGTLADHADGMRIVLEALRGDGALDHLDAIGHRIVHGGERFSAPVAIDAALLDELRATALLAPLHNPAGIAGIEACLAAFPALPQVAVFDTAFHHTLPAAAYRYAVPEDWYRQYGVRRYGFHGISHAHVARRAAAHLGRREDDCKLITLHLGNGASIAAIRDGRCVETSMGMTPLEGLVMGSRCGDLDAAVVPYMQRVAGMQAEAVESALNRASGLKGLCGDSDMRAILARVASGDASATLALEVYVHRIRKYLGAYVAVLGRPHALVFTGGVGENAAEVRARVCRDLEHLDIRLDAQRNASGKDVPLEFQSDTKEAAIKLLAIPTDEELEIAMQTRQALE